MRPSTAFLHAFAALLAAALPASSSGAENLVANGGFHEGISNWSRLDVVSFSAGGAATPGSARITLPSLPEGGERCV